MQRTKPPFRADHVGSLLRTAPLREAREQHTRGDISADALREVEDREIEGIIKKQEAVGLQSVTDGEFRRRSWNFDFLERLDGVESYLGERKIKFNTSGPQPRPYLLRVVGKLGGYTPHPMIEHFKFLHAHTKAVAKLTIPSPSSLHFRYGRDAVPESIYPSMDEFYRDLGVSYRKAVRAFADAGCRYLQIDEVNLAYLCDPSLREHIIARGEDPATLPAVYASLINAAISDIPPDMTITMHLCRGNFRSELRRQRRLRAGRRDSVQHHQRPRLFHGVRQRSRRRLRAAALFAQGQAGGARPRHLENRRAGEQRRYQAADRGGGEIRCPRSALPVAAMRFRLDRGGQRACRRRAMGEAADDRGNRRGSLGIIMQQAFSGNARNPDTGRGTAPHCEYTRRHVYARMGETWNG